MLILLVAAGLRFHDLGVQSLWNDEGSSYVQATRSFADIATNAAADIHPPGYYWALRMWRGLVGESEFALRYLSALGGVLTVAFAYATGRLLHAHDRRYGQLTGLAAAAIVTLNTFAIFYSQEMRMYAALGLWGAASMWMLIGFFYTPTVRNGAGLAVVNALGLWTQYAFPLVMLAQGVVALLWLTVERYNFWRKLRAYVVVNGAAIALFAPQLPTALNQVTTWPNTGDNTPVPEALGMVAGWLSFGITFTETGASWLAVMLILALIGMTGLGVPRGYVHNAWRSLLPVIFLVVPVGIFIGAGLFREGNIKFLLPAQVAFALAVGQGVPAVARVIRQRRHDATTLRPTQKRRLARNRTPSVTVLLAAVAIAGILYQMVRAVPPLYTDATYFRNDYRAIVQRIAPIVDSDDVIILNAPGQQEVFNYYYDGPAAPVGIPFGLNDTDAQIEQATQVELQGADDIYVVLWGDAERDPNGIVERTLDSGAFEVSNKWYGDVRLARYVTEADRFDFVNDTFTATFGENIILDQVALNTRDLLAGEVLQVRLFWRTTALLDERYKVTLQLLDENGGLVAQRDSEPGGGNTPTSEWPLNREVTDNHALLIPADILENAPEANFTLIIALYNHADSSERLPVNRTEQDTFTLTTVTITEPEGNE